MKIKQLSFLIGLPLGLVMIYGSLRLIFPLAFPISGLFGIGLGCVYVLSRLLGNVLASEDQHRFLRFFFRSLLLRLIGLIFSIIWLNKVTELDISYLFGGFFLGYYIQSWAERSYFYSPD